MNKIILWRISAVLSGLVGITLLAAVFLPILSYETKSRERHPSLLSPLVEASGGPKLTDLDYTRASNWFIDEKPAAEFKPSNISFYKLSIPRLRIKEVVVAIGGEDLSENLIQYPGTANPGRNGNTVVFGHSILPQFFNPESYISIFSTLPELEDGDIVKIDYDGVTYRYRVEDMFEVKPTELEVLEQGQHDSFLSLITCVPPGHPLKPRRLVVKARIIPLN